MSQCYESEFSGGPLSRQEWADSIHQGLKAGNWVEILDQIIVQAMIAGISDIHFRTEENGIKILVRKDGYLRDLVEIPQKYGETLFARLKILGRLVSYQKRVPQDGHIDPKPYSFDPSIDLRIAIAPVVWGEQAVIRILYGTGGLIPLESLGWSSKALERYRQVLSLQRGVVLFTGPCGSGKTTTIAASLQTLSESEGINICTVEDPVEYRLAGVNQMNIDESAGLGFTEGMRAWLRHDPDVLAVGEIRDPATASVVIESGLVGHLVFSSVHGGSVAAVILRLLDMGITPGTLAAALTLVVSQRLVRKLCPECRCKSTQWPDAIKPEMRPSHFKGFYSAQGCDSCEGTGYQGRQGLFELVVVEDELREAILNQLSVRDLQEIIQSQAICTLWSHGWQLVQEGITTPEELLRVIGI